MAKKKEPEHRHGELSVVDQFYIQEHGFTPVDDLVTILGRPKEQIQAYVDQLAKEFRKKGRQKPKASELMDRPAKGVISMTAGASQAGDDSKYNNLVTKSAIEQAQMDGDFEAVKKLKDRYDQQQRDNKNVIKKQYKDVIFHIIPIDEEDDIY